MTMRRLFTFLLLVLLALLLLGTLVLGPRFLSFSWMHVAALYGYCTPEERFLSEQDKIRTAVKKVNARTSIYVDADQKFYPRIRHESADEFMRSNPECCSILPANNWERFINSIGGSASSVVSIDYKMNYWLPTGKIVSRKMNAVVSVDACGGVSDTFE